MKYNSGVKAVLTLKWKWNRMRDDNWISRTTERTSRDNTMKRLAVFKVEQRAKTHFAFYFDTERHKTRIAGTTRKRRLSVEQLLPLLPIIVII